ncbi:MAG: structural protein P5 [Prevotella sp.]|nr:structural protein P5 [Prevotella sp.]MBQ9232334.1 structural protein P5 [Prevotella sp.]
MSTNEMARGLRNNNPLNIVKSPDFCWLGEVKEGGDKIFVKFETMPQGCRAALKLLRTYYEKHKCNTICRIIRRWAPETENNVQAYIKTVSLLTGIAPTTLLPPMKEETKIVWCDLTVAMASVECGLDQHGREVMAGYVDIGWQLLNP